MQATHKQGGILKTYRVTTNTKGRPRKEPAQSVLSVPMPKGTTHLSEDGEAWHRASEGLLTARYARTDTGQHYRRVRPQDVGPTNGTHWQKVTAAHVRHMAGLKLWGVK